jgi:hypothetical protein
MEVVYSKKTNSKFQKKQNEAEPRGIKSKKIKPSQKLPVHKDKTEQT